MFITALALCVICAGVLYFSSGSLREQSLRTGAEAQQEINALITSTIITGLDGTDGTLERFEHDIKLGPGSNELQFSRTLLSVLTYDETVSLTYRGPQGGFFEDPATGFYTLKEEVLGNVSSTPSVLQEDFDLDGAADQVSLDAQGRIVLSFSGGHAFTLGSFNCSGTFHDISGSYEVTDPLVASVEAVGSCRGGALDDANATVTLVPTAWGSGFYTVQYLHRSPSTVPGNLQAGDIARVYYETARSLTPNEEVQVRLVPKSGTPSMVHFSLPAVISQQRLRAYPP